MTKGDVIVLLVLLLIVGAIVTSILRSRKKGKHCACGTYRGCAMAGSCHSGENG